MNDEISTVEIIFGVKTVETKTVVKWAKEAFRAFTEIDSMTIKVDGNEVL